MYTFFLHLKLKRQRRTVKSKTTGHQGEVPLALSCVHHWHQGVMDEGFRAVLSHSYSKLERVGEIVPDSISLYNPTDLIVLSCK